MVYLAAAVAATAYLLCAPVWFALCIGLGGARFFGLGIGFLPDAARKRSLRSLNRRPGRGKRRNVRARAELIRRILSLARRGKVDEIRLSGALNVHDAARTAVAVGATEAAARGLAAVADCRVRGEIRPDFSDGGNSARVILTASCPLRLLVRHAVCGYLQYKREEWENGKASH